MKVAICSHEKRGRERLNEQIGNWGHRMHEQVRIKEYESAENFLYWWGEQESYDLVFISVDLPDMGGLALAEVIRKCHKHIGIVLMGADSEAVYKGYELDALYYLLLPAKQEECDKCMNLLQNRQKIMKDGYIVVERSGEIRRLNYEEVDYFEAVSHYIVAHFKGGELKFRKNIGRLREELPSEEFIDVHRSYIVNINRVERLERNRVELTDGVTLPVSRGRSKTVRDMFKQCVR